MQSSVDDVVLPDTLLRTESEGEDRAWPRSPAVLLFWQECDAVRARMRDLALVSDHLPTEILLRYVPFCTLESGRGVYGGCFSLKRK